MRHASPAALRGRPRAPSYLRGNARRRAAAAISQQPSAVRYRSFAVGLRSERATSAGHPVRSPRVRSSIHLSIRAAVVRVVRVLPACFLARSLPLVVGFSWTIPHRTDTRARARSVLPSRTNRGRIDSANDNRLRVRGDSVSRSGRRDLGRRPFGNGTWNA